MEATLVSITGWTDKQNVVYIYNGILSSLKKEGNSNIYYNMDKPWGHYARWNKPVTKIHILCASLYMRNAESKSEREKVDWWFPGTAGRKQCGGIPFVCVCSLRPA